MTVAHYYQQHAEAGRAILPAPHDRAWLVAVRSVLGVVGYVLCHVEWHGIQGPYPPETPLEALPLATRPGTPTRYALARDIRSGV